MYVYVYVCVCVCDNYMIRAIGYTIYIYVKVEVH